MDRYLEPDLNLKGIIPLLEENTLKNDDTFPYSGLWLFSGSQGSGKTLLMMHLLKMIVEEYPEVTILSDISIYGIPSISYTDVSDIEKYSNGKKGLIVVLDEIHTLFNSLESKNMPLNTMQVWCQNRKNKRLILATSQRFTRVGKPIREQCHLNYECKKLLPFLFAYRVKNGEDYDDNGNYLGENNSYSYYIPKVSVMHMYNTLEVVKREDHTKESEKTTKITNKERIKNGYNCK